MASFASSYIKTEASQVTRSADASYIDTSPFSAFFNIAEGTIYSDAVLTNTTNNSSPFGFRSPSGSFDLVLGNFRFGQSGQSVDLTQSLSVASYKAACAYTNNSVHSLSLNGSTVTSTTGVQTMPTVTALFIGNGSSSANVSTAFTLNGTVKKLAYYPARLTNTQLQALTQQG